VLRRLMITPSSLDNFYLAVLTSSEFLAHMTS